MSADQIFSWRNRWFAGSIGITAGLLVATALGGFILLPYLQPNLKFSGIWDAICSAAGLVRPSTGANAIQPDYKISTVSLTSGMFAQPSPEAIGRGATLAQQCAICHGPTGISRADSPNLSGQYAAVIYKELMDFKTGARVNAVMTPFAEPLSDQDMRDIAVYYAYLPRLPAYHTAQSAQPPKVVVYGAPMRGIAPCGACHGTLDNKAGSPWLEGQPATYIKAQLQAFAAGTRRNDPGGLMRNIAKQMTPEEIDEAARYYSSQQTFAAEQR
jgi:cytochrome c553